MLAKWVPVATRVYMYVMQEGVISIWHAVSQHRVPLGVDEAEGCDAVVKRAQLVPHLCLTDECPWDCVASGSDWFFCFIAWWKSAPNAAEHSWFLVYAWKRQWHLNDSTWRHFSLGFDNIAVWALHQMPLFQQVVVAMLQLGASLRQCNVAAVSFSPPATFDPDPSLITETFLKSSRNK